MIDYICNGDKYAYGKGYIYMPFEINGLPEKMKVEGVELQVQTSFHVSLLCLKDILEKYPDKVSEEEIIKTFCEFVSKNDVSFLKIKNEFRFVEFEERKSLVVMCDISGMDDLFQVLQNKFDVRIPLQPTHITLYTLKQNEGIGMTSYRQLGERSILIDVSADLKNLLSIV